MKRFTELLSGTGLMLFQAALTGWIFCLAKINNDFTQMSLSYLPLCAMFLLAYFLDRLMLHKAAPVPLFAFAQLLFIAAGAWLFCRCIHIEPFKLSTVIINCGIYCVGFIVACFVAWLPPNENAVLMRFDALVVMVVTLLVLDHLMELPAAGAAIIMCAVCLLLIMCSGISMRSGRLVGRGGAVQGNPALGRIVLGVVLAVLAGLTALVVMFATSGMKSFLDFFLIVVGKVSEAVMVALRWIYGLIERFMVWLSQFATDAPMEPIENQMGPVVDSEIVAGDTATMPEWIVPAAIVLAAVLIGLLIFRLRHVKVGRVHYVSRMVQIQKRESGVKEAMAKMLERVKAEIIFRWRCLSRRKSPAALLVWCEKQVDSDSRRKQGESGQNFLRRISDELGGEEALVCLADCVEQAFYSPAAVTVPGDVYKAVRHVKFKKKTDAE